MYICVFVTKLVAICIVCTSKAGHYRVLYGILNICNVESDIAENALFKEAIIVGSF